MPLLFSSINSIQNFGLYQNFVWDATTLGRLDRYNLVLGHNYSGKTTLSRVFQAMEDGSVSRDYIGATFEAELNDHTILAPPLLGKQGHLRVFNRDFVSRNFHQTADMTGAAAITVVGEVNQILKDRVTRLTRKGERLQGFKERLLSEARLIQSELDTAGTAQAALINHIVGGGRYTRASLNVDLGKLPRQYTPLPLEGPELEQIKERYRRAGDFEKVPIAGAWKKINNPSFPPKLALIRIVRKTLKEVATNRALAALKASRELETWIETGIVLNGDDQPCAFCGSTIPPERWEEIRGHFSQAFSDLQRRVKLLSEFIALIALEPVTVKPNDLFPELRERFNALSLSVANASAALIEALRDLASIVESKTGNLEKSIEWSPELESLRDYMVAVRALNSLIDEHNALVAGADNAKAEAKGQVCIHFAVDYLKSTSYWARKEAIEKRSTRVREVDAGMGRIRAKITEAEAQIKAASVGIQKINYYLGLLLRGDIIGYKLNDTDFEFRRSGQLARNMSEGERTAVAFSYFLATLEDGGNTIPDLTIVVDDPISSLDENHIYDVSAIVKDVLGKANQLIVLTHNMYFFGLVKDWMKDKTGGRFKFLMTHRVKSAQDAWTSTLVALPRLLRNFKSTYQQEYYRLKKLNDDPNPSAESLNEVPNLLRGVLEAYLGFMFPEAGGINDKLPKILNDTTKCEAIAKFAHDNSHRHSSMTLGEIQAFTIHSKNMVADTLDAIKAYSPDHVASMEALFQKEAAHLV